MKIITSISITLSLISTAIAGNLRNPFYTSIAVSDENSLAPCASDCPDTPVQTAESYFSNIAYNATNCFAVQAFCKVAAQQTNWAEVVYVRDSDGTTVPEKYSADITNAGLPPITTATISERLTGRSQNSFVSGIVMPALSLYVNLQMPFKGGTPDQNAANMAQWDNNVETQSFTYAFQKFFFGIDTRFAGMPTENLVAANLAAYTVIPELGIYFDIDNAFYNYLHAQGATGYIQTGGLPYQPIALSRTYPQSYSQTIGSDACDPLIHDSKDMLPPYGCPMFSDGPVTTTTFVDATPNTQVVCGLDYYNSTTNCVDDGSGKGYNLAYIYSAFGIAPTFFFGNSNGDIYPANFTLNLMANGILPATLAFINDNAGVCEQIGAPHNVSCINIVNSNAQRFPMVTMTQQTINDLVTSYKSFVAVSSAKKDSSLDWQLAFIITASFAGALLMAATCCGSKIQEFSGSFFNDCTRSGNNRAANIFGNSDLDAPLHRPDANK